MNDTIISIAEIMPNEEEEEYYDGEEDLEDVPIEDGLEKNTTLSKAV
jgi:hypothetical protein